MLEFKRNTPKGKIQDLVDELLQEIEGRSTPDRLSAAAAVQKQAAALSIITDVWRSWVSNVTLLDLLSSDDLEKMVRDFTIVLITITPASAHFSDIIEEWDKKNIPARQEESSEGIKPV